MEKKEVIAKYDLKHQGANFEFSMWLVLVVAKGATEIVIDKSNPKTSKIPLNLVMQRVESILIPCCALAGMNYRFGTDEGIVARAPEFLDWKKPFNRLTSVKGAADATYTVTIRKNPTAICRNSNEAAWREFAKRIGAVVIEDYAVKPIHLHDRMALYAGAKMNFGVCNGPMGLLGLTPYPMRMMVSSDSARNSQLRNKTPLNGQCHWFLENQKLVWREDNIDNLMQTFSELP